MVFSAIRVLPFSLATAMSVFFGGIANAEDLSPVVTRSKPNLTPPGVSSAFISQGGDLYIYASSFGYSNVGNYFSEDSDNIYDTSFGVGLGLGSSYKAVAVEIGVDYASLKDSNVGFGFNFSIARSLLVNDSLEVAFGVGTKNLAAQGLIAANGQTPYGVLSVYKSFVKSGTRFIANLGIGSGGYDYDSQSEYDLLSPSPFGSIGFDVSSRLGLSVGWAEGLGNLTAKVSWVPFSNAAFTVDMGASNIAQTYNRSFSPFISFAVGLN